jgi:hypothetical protein
LLSSAKHQILGVDNENHYTMKTVNRALRSVIVASAIAALSSYAASIDPGNLLIYRVGDGTAALAASTTAAFIDEYTPLGTFVQSIALPTSGAGLCTAVGNATTEGIMSVVNNGTLQAKVVFTGYQLATGVSGTPGTTVYRVIGTVGLSGVADTTSFAVTDSGSTAVRSATSTDGSSLFYLGTASGVRYIASPGTAATSTLIDSRNSRQVLLNGPKLFASNGSTGVTGKIQDYGNLPTTTTTANPDVVLATADAVNGFLFLDQSTSEAGDDTIYALSTVEGLLRKYSLVGGVWTANGSIATGALNLTGYADSDGAHLFLTSSSTLYSELDASGYNATITGSLTTLATAASNEAFRGISVVPEPSTFCLALVGAASLLALRRRQS